MKKIIALIIMIIVVVGVGFISWLVSQQQPERSSSVETQNENQPMSSESILIVYLSRTGNTEAVAQMIQEEVGGTLIGIELENPYPEDYQAIVSQVDRENETGYLPPLETSIDNIEQYDTIYFGAPTWDMQLPPPMKSFLEEYDLSGKTVVPFNTNGGYGVGSSFDDIETRCAGCTVLEGFSVEGGLERDGILFVMEGEKETEVRMQVVDWLKRLNLLN